MGTWTIPKENWEKAAANAAADHLESFKKMIDNVVGDDKLFDDLDSAIKRIKKLAK